MRNLFVGLIGLCASILLFFAGCNEQKTVARYDVGRSGALSAQTRLDTSFAAAVPVHKNDGTARRLPGFLLPDPAFESSVSVLALETASFVVDTDDLALQAGDAILVDPVYALAEVAAEPTPAEMLVEVAAAGGSPVEQAPLPAPPATYSRAVSSIPTRTVIRKPMDVSDVAWPVAEESVRGWVETSGAAQRNDTDGPELESTRGGVVAPGQYRPQPLAEILITEAPKRRNETALKSRKALDKNLARLGWVESRWSRNRAY